MSSRSGRAASVSPPVLNSVVFVLLRVPLLNLLSSVFEAEPKCLSSALASFFPRLLPQLARGPCRLIRRGADKNRQSIRQQRLPARHHLRSAWQLGTDNL